MVSFSCENCGDIMTKKKLDPHKNRCHSCTFTCIDCMTHFQGFDYRSHTSCISEAQKYQGKLYKEKPVKGKGATPKSITKEETAAIGEEVPQEAAVTKDVADSETSKSTKKRKRDEGDAVTKVEPANSEPRQKTVQPTTQSKKSKKSKGEKSTEPVVTEMKDAEARNGDDDGGSLLASFISIANKELKSKDEIDFARLLKKWRKKNDGKDSDGLWNVLRLRKGEGKELIIV